MRTPNIVNMEYGSRLYGTATQESDTDYAGIYMPTMHELLLQKAGKGISTSTGKDHQKNTKDDVDSVVFSLPHFVNLCLAGDTTALDMLHCDFPLSSSWVWEELRGKRQAFYSKGMKAYVGYAKSQAMKYGVKGDRVAELKAAIDFLKEFLPKGDWPSLRLGTIWDKLPESEYVRKVTDQAGNRYWSVLGKQYQSTNSVEHTHTQLVKTWDSYGHRSKCAMENAGMDWKALHHSLRVMYQTRAIFEHGDFRFPLEETAFLMRVKRGDVDYMAEIAPEFDKFFETFDDLAEKSGLPKQPDHQYWEKWLIGVYDEWFNISYKEE